MLCESCDLTGVCKLYGYLETQGLLEAVVLAECHYFTPAEARAGEGSSAVEDEAAEEPSTATGAPPPPKVAPAPATLPVEERYRHLILAYGGLDGLLSATAVVYENSLQDYRIYFTHPARLQEAAAQLHPGLEQVYICDLGVNHKNPVAMQRFLEALEPHTFHWFDHHPGWVRFLKRHLHGTEPKAYQDQGFHCDETVSTSLSLVTDDQLLRSIIEATLPEAEQSHPLATLFTEALQAAPSDHSTRYDIVNYLLVTLSQGEGSALQSREHQRLKEKAERYQKLKPTQQTLVEEGEQIGEVLVMRKPVNRWVNFTELFTQALHRSPHAIILVEKKSGLSCCNCGATFRQPSPYADCPRCHSDDFSPATAYNTLVATSTEVNLQELFGIYSGSPQRLTLYGDRLEDAVRALNRAGEGSQPATAETATVPEEEEAPAAPASAAEGAEGTETPPEQATAVAEATPEG